MESELTGNRTFFRVMSFQVMLSNAVSSALLRKRVTIVLLGDAITAGPTLESCAVQRIFLPQIGKSQTEIVRGNVSLPSQHFRSFEDDVSDSYLTNERVTYRTFCTSATAPPLPREPIESP